MPALISRTTGLRSGMSREQQNQKRDGKTQAQIESRSPFYPNGELERSLAMSRWRRGVSPCPIHTPEENKMALSTAPGTKAVVCRDCDYILVDVPLDFGAVTCEGGETGPTHESSTMEVVLVHATGEANFSGEGVAE